MLPAVRKGVPSRCPHAKDDEHYKNVTGDRPGPWARRKDRESQIESNDTQRSKARVARPEGRTHALLDSTEEKNDEVQERKYDERKRDRRVTAHLRVLCEGAQRDRVGAE